MYYNDTTLVYQDGEFLRAVDAKADPYSQSLQYGYAVFEGMRSYRDTAGRASIFEAEAHYVRLENSAKALNIPWTWTVQELIAITYELLEKNQIEDAYIRPIIYAPANMGFLKNSSSHIFIAAWKMTPFFGENLLRVTTSPFQRPNPKAFLLHAKVSGHYVNSIMASHEAKARGYDEALLTDMNGHVAEGSGANVFFEKAGVLYTPSRGHILPGITRATVLQIAEELKMTVVEKVCTLAELQEADSAFFCGTAAEVIGWKSFNDREYPLAWEDSLGKKLQVVYRERVRIPAAR